MFLHLMAPRKVVALGRVKSVWLGLGYISAPVIGDRISTLGNLGIKSVGGMVSQKQI